MLQSELHALLPSCLELAQQAGEEILHYWQRRRLLQIQHKTDKTPVTAADLAAHRVLNNGLQALTPQWPILSEEGEIPSYRSRRDWQCYWLLDPLDGTRGFVRGSAEFAVNIALIVDNQPKLGIIYAPVTQIYYYAYHQGGAFKKIAEATPVPLCGVTYLQQSAWRIAIGQYHRVQSWVYKLPIAWQYNWLRLNSSLKFGALAEGSADVYVRYGPTSEWDTAAGECILQEAGGVTVALTGQKLQYNRKPSLINPNFIAMADATQLQQWLTVLREDHKNDK